MIRTMFGFGESAAVTGPRQVQERKTRVSFWSMLVEFGCGRLIEQKPGFAFRPIAPVQVAEDEVDVGSLGGLKKLSGAKNCEDGADPQVIDR
jgi:hypothetical protein